MLSQVLVEEVCLQLLCENSLSRSGEDWELSSNHTGWTGFNS